jgi:hypothetical protein
MSLKQWHKHDPIIDDAFSLANSRINSRAATSTNDDGGFIQDEAYELGSRPGSRARTDPAQKDAELDPAMWQMWEEKEGDQDGSGDIAMLCGDLDYDKNCIDSRREFHSDPHEGWVMLKSSDLPAWAG